MSKQEKQQRAFEAIKAAAPSLSWREATIRNLIVLGVHPSDRLELRVQADGHHDLPKLIQRAADAFFSAFSAYPSAIALHPVALAYLEASERPRIIARHHAPDEILPSIMGSDFEATPIPFATDAGLEPNVVAVRLTLDMDAYGETMLSMVLQVLKGGE